MMGSERSQRQTVTTGRPLDATGTPMDSPALDIDPEGCAGTLLAASPHPLVSSPDAGVWATLLELPADGETDRPVVLQWVAPDATAPPPHVHPATETFECLDGEFTAVIEGTPHRLRPGESVTVEPDTEHTFRNETEQTVAVRAELPSMRTVQGLYTAWALDHQGAAGGGEFDGPGPLDALVLAADLYDETVMTMAPIPVQRFLWATVGRAARTLGHTGIDERYTTETFWERHVEQPQF